MLFILEKVHKKQHCLKTMNRSSLQIKWPGLTLPRIIYQAGDLAINYIRCHHAHPLDETICNIQGSLSPPIECQACDIAGRNSEQYPLHSMQAKFCHQPRVIFHYTFQFMTLQFTSHFIWNKHFICSITHINLESLAFNFVSLAHLAKARDKLVEPLKSHYTVRF